MQNCPSPEKETVSRRAYLLAVGAGVTTIAGCTSDGNTDDSGENEDNSPENGEGAEPEESNGDSDEPSADLASVTDVDWSQFGTDHQNTGSVDTVGPQETPETLWEFETNERVDGQLALTDGVIYAAAGSDSTGTVYALTLEGEELWSHETGGLEGASPTVHDGVVYVGGREADDDAGFSTSPPEAKLYAVDAENGEEKWQFGTDDAFLLSAPPVVANGTVYIGSETVIGSTSIYAIDLESGEEEWSESFGDRVTSPVIANDTLYVGSSDDNLYALDPETGDERWRFDTGDFITAEPSVKDGTVYVGNHSGLYAVSADGGTEEWFAEGGSISSGLAATQAVTDDAVYMATQSVITRVSLNGETDWWEDTLTGGGLPYHPLVTDNLVYLASGDLFAYDTDSGDEVWVFEDDDISVRGRPIVSDGMLYVGGREGIYAFS